LLELQFITKLIDQKNEYNMNIKKCQRIVICTIHFTEISSFYMRYNQYICFRIFWNLSTKCEHYMLKVTISTSMLLEKKKRIFCQFIFMFILSIRS